MHELCNMHFHFMAFKKDKSLYKSANCRTKCSGLPSITKNDQKQVFSGVVDEFVQNLQFMKLNLFRYTAWNWPERPELPETACFPSSKLEEATKTQLPPISPLCQEFGSDLISEFI